MKIVFNFNDLPRNPDLPSNEDPNNQNMDQNKSFSAKINVDIAK